MKKIGIAALILLLIDQLIKGLVMNFLELGEMIEVIKGNLYITYLKNTGAAFNIMSGQTLILIFLGFIALFFIVTLIREEKNLDILDKVSYTFLFSGITGNLIDRIFLGGVVDYIHIKFIEFPVFNLSDSLIVIGVALFAYNMIRGELHAKINK